MSCPQNHASTRLADQLERGFRGGAWHGPALMEVLAGVDGSLAAWRPTPVRHGIGELVGHLTFWMDHARRQVLGEDPGRPGPEGDWPGPPASEAAWHGQLTALEAAHTRLREALEALPDARLEEARSGSDTTLRGLLVGTLQHNAYHAGQIALVRLLAREPGGRS